MKNASPSVNFAVYQEKLHYTYYTRNYHLVARRSRPHTLKVKCFETGIVFFWNSKIMKYQKAIFKKQEKKQSVGREKYTSKWLFFCWLSSFRSIPNMVAILFVLGFESLKDRRSSIGSWDRVLKMVALLVVLDFRSLKSLLCCWFRRGVRNPGVAFVRPVEITGHNDWHFYSHQEGGCGHPEGCGSSWGSNRSKKFAKEDCKKLRKIQLALWNEDWQLDLKYLAGPG